MNKLYKTKVLLKVASMVLLLITGTLPTHGQGVTTATITGKVTSNDAESLPGASVTAVHQPSGTMYGISARSDGRFSLPNLRIGGPYTITVSFVGYESQKVENVFLTLGQSKSFEFELKQSAAELQEIVISTTSGFDKDRTGASVAFDNNAIRNMPTITRSAADIYRLTPSSDGNSFAGRNDQFNNFSLNGAIFNNPFGLDAATPGGQTDAQPISLDAIDQIQVSVAPYDVTQSGFTGASVNAVTKSGTNKFSGTAFSFYRTDALTGSKIKGEKVFVPDLTQLQSGFSFGGPIVKDKLFFFTNFEIERRDDLGSSFVAKRGAQGDANESRVEATDLDFVSFLLDSAFNYQTGPCEGYTHETNNQKGIIKIDWNINRSHTLTAIYNFLDASKQKPANPFALGRRGPDATTLQFFNAGYKINNEINSAILELKSLFGNSFSNKFQVGYTEFDDSRDPFSEAFPVVNIAQNGSRYIIAGHEPFSINNRLNQKVFQASNNFEIYSGDHTITLGTSYERFEFDNSFNLGVYEPFGVPYPGGTFSGPGFASVNDFAAFVRGGSMQPVVDYARNVYSAQNWALAETNVGQWALYAQDNWAVNDRFTLTYGLRMDLPLYFDTQEKIEENIERKGGLWDPANNSFGNYNPAIQYYDENGDEVTLSSTKLPNQTPLFSPRVGFNYLLGNDESTVLRGGSGLFTGRFPFVWVGNQVANPDFFFYTVTDPDFKFPQVWRTNLGIDKNFGEGWRASTDLIYSKDINAMLVRNYGRSLPTGNLVGADNRAFYTAADKSVDQFGGATNAYVFTNTNIGYTLNLTFELKRNWSNGLYTTIAYNYLDAKDASSIDAEISSDAFDRNPALGNVNTPQLAPSLFGNKHRVVGTANKTFTYGGGRHATTLSLFFEYARGGRYSYTYSGDVNGDGSSLNDLIYVPTENEINTLTFRNPTFPGDPTVAQQRQALEAYIRQDEYLSERRGNYAEKYETLSPWFSRYDFRLLQDYKLGNGNSVQLSIDILNIGNFISSEWGVRQFPTNTQPIGVSVDGAGNPTYSFDPALTSTFTNDASLQSRWQMQFGLRYTF